MTENPYKIRWISGQAIAQVNETNGIFYQEGNI